MVALVFGEKMEERLEKRQTGGAVSFFLPRERRKFQPGGGRRLR